jgi:hypothetical protein
MSTKTRVRDGNLRNRGNYGKTKKEEATPENRYTKMEMYQLSKLFILMLDIQGGFLFD